MIIYSERNDLEYKSSVMEESSTISDKSTVVKASTLSQANKQFLKQLGFKLKVKKRNVKNKK